MKSTYSIIFYLKREKLKKDGTYPVMGRITVDGTQCQFSCKVDCKPDLWETKGGRAIGKSVMARNVNMELDKIKARIDKYYKEIVDRDNFVTAEKVKNAFLGLEYRQHTLMTMFAQWNEEYKKMHDGGLRSKASLHKYQAVYKHVGEFLRQHYRVSDMALKEIQPSFVSDFEVYLKTERNISHNTCILYNNAIMMLMHRAHENGWVSRYPFSDYHIQKEETEKGFLTKEELNALMNNPRLTPRRAYIRDLFIFCCFTGLAHADLKNLKNENIVKNPADGSWWIHTHRQKTGVAENVKLLPIPLAILKKYKGLCTDGHVFDVPNHKSCCKRIRFVAKLCGITKNLTWHMARHTMATVVCLSNGMPLEVVGSVLGHKCIESTQVYAKITQEKLGCEIDTLATKLAKIQQFSPNIGMVI